MSDSESSFDDQPSIVIDNGSYKILAGFGGDDAPRCITYCLAGKGKDAIDSVYYGDEAYKKRSTLDVKCPIQQGLITDWEAMEKVFNDLQPIT